MASTGLAATYGPAPITSGITVGATADTVVAGTNISAPSATSAIAVTSGAGPVTIGALGAAPVILTGTNAPALSNLAAVFDGTVSVTNATLTVNDPSPYGVTTDTVLWFNSGSGPLSIDHCTIDNTSLNPQSSVSLKSALGLFRGTVNINHSSVTASRGLPMYIWNYGSTVPVNVNVYGSTFTSPVEVGNIGSHLLLADDSTGTHTTITNTGAGSTFVDTGLALVSSTWNIGDPQSTITATNVAIASNGSGKLITGAVLTSGLYGQVALLADAANVSLTGGLITSAGDDSAALEFTDNSGGQQAYKAVGTLSGVQVSTSGNDAHGVLANLGSTVSVTGGTITSNGASSDGVHLTSADVDNLTLTGSASSLTLDGATVLAKGSASNALYVGDDSIATAKNALTLTSIGGPSVTLNGNGASIDASGVTVGTLSAAAARGVNLTGGTGQRATFAKTTFTNSSGAVFYVESSGSPASPSAVQLTSAIANAASGQDLLTVVAGSTASFSATDSTLSGTIRDSSGALDVSLLGTTTFTGAIDPANVTMAAASTWNMTANSLVANLTNAGTITLVDPVTPPALSLAINGTLTGTSAGSIALNTVLGTDGSASDTIVLDGAAATTAGVTTLKITNAGGSGAATTGNGILLVNTSAGGTTATGSFILSGPVTVTTAGITYTYALKQVGQNWYLQSTANQVITFPTQATQTYSPTGTFALSPAASASSGLAVTYTSTTPSVCSISGTAVTVLSTGVCSIAADQPGDASYGPASQVVQSITITPAGQSITFGAQAAQTFIANGSFALNPLASASSSLPVTYATATPAVCSISGSSVMMVSAGTCTISASQSGNSNYAAAKPVSRNIAIGLAGQTITFGAQAPATFVAGGTVELNPLASANSGLAVTYTAATPAVCSINGSTVTLIAAGTCTITASQAGDNNYAAATPVSQNLAIGQASQTITFGSQAGVSFVAGGTVALNPSATASSGLVVTYRSITPGVCSINGSTVTLVAAGTCVIAADQAGDSNYAAATQVTQTILVSSASQAITFGAQSDQTFTAGATFTLNPPATASSGLAVAYASSTPNVCTVSGSTVTMMATGTCTLLASQLGNANYSAATSVSRSFELIASGGSIPGTADPVPSLDWRALVALAGLILMAASCGAHRLRL